MKKNFFIILAFAAAFIACNKRTQSWSVTSPDSTLKFSVQLENSQLFYQVESINSEKIDLVIEKSPLGIVRKDADFSKDLSFESAGEIKTIDETYKMLIGKQSECRNHANEITITFKNKSNSQIQIIARAYNDGVAFLYCFPEKSKIRYTVTSELTGYKIPVDGRAWMIQYDSVSEWSPGYEKDYKGAMKIGKTAPGKCGWALPALFNANGYWMLLCEANMDTTYCGIHLEQHAENGLYKVRFPEEAEGYGVLGSSEPSSTLPWVTPWRIIVIGKTPAAMIETNLVYNLSAPCILQDISWIKPGRASWSWWGDHNSPMYESKLKTFIDLAKEMGWEYSLVDALWNKMKEGNIESLIKYANSKNVGVTLWYNSGGPHNKVFGDAVPRDLMHIDSIREKEFARIEKLGVKGIKVDFFQSDKQNLMKLYLAILESAARQHLLVDFHGCTIPRGWSRTYPNLMSMEGVSGSEQYSWDTVFAENAQTHNATLPYTRNAIGPMDYTPMTFTHYNDVVHHKTTYAHELALTVIFESGILHFAERVSAVRALPDYVKDFLKSVPVTWDETKYITGEPGSEIVLARRKGDVWYIAGINGEKKEKELTLRLPFIKEGKYKLELITDGIKDTTFEHIQSDFDGGGDTFNIVFLARGGFVGRLIKE
jgi:alpha-glucosidase